VSTLSRNSPTLVVDLDGTLVNTDMTVENLFLFLSLHPLRIFETIAWLFKGRANFKRCLADTIVPDVSNLPYNRYLLTYLDQQRTAGAALILATASDLRIARKVSEHLGLFDEVLGTEEINLSSRNKREALVRRYGERGYEYVGNSAADLTVWETASAIHVVNPERGVLAAARKIGPVEMVLQNRPAYLGTLSKALRIHQWTKNLLLFVPLLAAHRFMADEMFGFGFQHVEDETELHQGDLMMIRGMRAHGKQQPMAIHNRQNFHAFPAFGETYGLAPTLGRGKRRILPIAARGAT